MSSAKDRELGMETFSPLFPLAMLSGRFTCALLTVLDKTKRVLDKLDRQIRLDQIRLDQIRLDQIRLDRLDKIRLDLLPARTYLAVALNRIFGQGSNDPLRRVHMRRLARL